MVLKNRFLREIDISVSLNYENGQQFMRESRCVLYALSEKLINKKTKCNFDKLSFKIWPVGGLKCNEPSRAILDNESRVISVEVEYDLSIYYLPKDQGQRWAILIEMISTFVDLIPVESEVSREGLLSVLEMLQEENAFKVSKTLGRPTYNNLRTLSAKLGFTFDEEKILIFALVSNIDKEVKKISIASYSTFENYRLDHLGRLIFVDENVLGLDVLGEKLRVEIPD